MVSLPKTLNGQESGWRSEQRLPEVSQSAENSTISSGFTKYSHKCYLPVSSERCCRPQLFVPIH